MLKLIIGEYRCRFLIVFKQNRNRILWYFFWSYVYYMLIMRLDVVKYTIGMVPLLAGFWLSRMYPNELSKMLFLCPMSKEDRVRYLWTAYGLRVGVSIGLYAVISLPVVLSGSISWHQYRWLTLAVVSFILGANMHHSFLSLSIARTKGDKDYRISFVYGLLSLSSQICAWYIMTAFAFPSYGLEIQNGRKIWIAVVLIELLINLEICAICYKPVIRNGMNYESCRMIGTTQKNVQTERNAGS